MTSQKFLCRSEIACVHVHSTGDWAQPISVAAMSERLGTQLLCQHVRVHFTAWQCLPLKFLGSNNLFAFPFHFDWNVPPESIELTGVEDKHWVSRVNAANRRPPRGMPTCNIMDKCLALPNILQDRVMLFTCPRLRCPCNCDCFNVPTLLLFSLDWLVSSRWVWQPTTLVVKCVHIFRMSSMTQM